ncbi:MAG: hypothetical protein M3353_09160, partial [Actinomycetota bacterium]|nr:hypothetical protein [Actinomycetota bacterium]
AVLGGITALWFALMAVQELRRRREPRAAPSPRLAGPQWAVGIAVLSLQCLGLPIALLATPDRPAAVMLAATVYTLSFAGAWWVDERAHQQDAT